MTQNESQQNSPQVRIHITEPGPRSGEPYGLSIETINAGSLTLEELGREKDAAMALRDAVKAEMDKRVEA